MESHFVQGTIHYRHFSKERGLYESEHPFTSLDELYDLVVNAQDGHLIDRIVLDGTDANGETRSARFIFQSITRQELK